MKKVIVETNVIETLSSFSNINPSIQVMEGKPIKTISPTRSVLAISKEENPFPDFCVASIDKLTAAIKMFPSPLLCFEEKYVDITSAKNDGSSYRLYFTDPDNIETPPKKEISMPAPLVSFVLAESVLNKTFQAMRFGKMTEIAICGEGGNLVFRAFEAKGSIKDTFSSNIGTCSPEKDFRLTFKASNLSLAPGEYVVEAAQGMALFESTKTKYYISVEDNSSY